MCIAKQVACSSVAVYAGIVACYANNWLRKHKRHRLRVLATSTRRGRAPECLILIVAKTRLSGNFKVPVYIHIIERERERERERGGAWRRQNQLWKLSTVWDRVRSG